MVFAFGIPWHPLAFLRPTSSHVQPLPGVVQPCRGASQGAAPGGHLRCLEVTGLHNKYHITIIYSIYIYTYTSLSMHLYIYISIYLYIDPRLIIPYLYHIYCIPMPYLHHIYIRCDSYWILFDSMFDRGAWAWKTTEDMPNIEIPIDSLKILQPAYQDLTRRLMNCRLDSSQSKYSLLSWNVLSIVKNTRPKDMAWEELIPDPRSQRKPNTRRGHIPSWIPNSSHWKTIGGIPSCRGKLINGIRMFPSACLIWQYWPYRYDNSHCVTVALMRVSYRHNLA